MAQLFISEFVGFAYVAGQRVPGMPAGPSLRDSVLQLGTSASTMATSSATKFVVMNADSVCSIFIGSSASTGIASTTCRRVAANVDVPMQLPPYSRITAIANS